MNLEQALNKAITNLESGELLTEAAVKVAVVDSVLRALGWDPADPSRFKPEFAVGKRRVDYALLDRGKPLVFIEAKHSDVKIGKGEDQLFGYANHQGVPLLVLTNGWNWDFYLSMAAGLPPDRRFYSLDLRLGDNVAEYVEFLGQHLQKDRVVSGKARLSAEGMLQNNKDREKARDAIPGVWSGLIEGREEILTDLLAEEVESTCGVKPAVSDVHAFLAGLKPSGSIAAPTPVLGPLPGPSPPPPKAKLKGFVFNGMRTECKSAVSTLAEVLKAFQLENPGFMDSLAPNTVAKTSRLVAREHTDLYANYDSYRGKVRDLGNGWWMGTHYSSARIRKYIRVACEVAGVKLGSQLKLIEE